MGTAVGYSALLLAERLPLAEIDTIEIDALRNERAISVMQAAGFEQRVRCHLGTQEKCFPRSQGCMILFTLTVRRGNTSAI